MKTEAIGLVRPAEKGQDAAPAEGPGAVRARLHLLSPRRSGLSSEDESDPVAAGELGRIPGAGR